MSLHSRLTAELNEHTAALEQVEKFINEQNPELLLEQIAAAETASENARIDFISGRISHTERRVIDAELERLRNQSASNEVDLNTARTELRRIMGRIHNTQNEINTNSRAIARTLIQAADAKVVESKKLRDAVLEAAAMKSVGLGAANFAWNLHLQDVFPPPKEGELERFIPQAKQRLAEALEEDDRPA